MTKGTYKEFFEALGMRESSGDYTKINKKTRYLGKYQMGEAALVDCEYYRNDKHPFDNNFIDALWTGKDGVHSKNDFLNTPQAQENAVRQYANINWQKIKKYNLDLYIGETKHGYLLTISGMLAGAHLVGFGGLYTFVKTGEIQRDQFLTEITEYIKKFAGYDTPFTLRKKLKRINKDKKGKTIMYLIEDYGLVPKATAIEMVKNKEVDGVMVVSKNGNIFLRTRPDDKLNNNLE